MSDGSTRLEKIIHPAFTTISAIYCINTSFSQAFIAWRVYAVSRHKTHFANIFTFITAVSIAMGAVIVWKFSTIEDIASGVHDVRTMSIVTWILSSTLQAVGSAWISWRLYSIPVEAQSYTGVCRKLTGIIVSTTLLIVDSGCFLLVAEIITLAFAIAQLDMSLVVIVSILGQLSPFITLTVVMRESIKANNDLKKNLVNATSAFIVRRLPGSEAQHRRTSLSLEGSISPCDGVVVAIQQTEHKHFDMEDETSRLILPASVTAPHPIYSAFDVG